MFIRETRDPDAEKGASPKGGDMQCPLTSAKKYLRGPRFTKQRIHLYLCRASTFVEYPHQHSVTIWTPTPLGTDPGQAYLENALNKDAKEEVPVEDNVLKQEAEKDAAVRGLQSAAAAMAASASEPLVSGAQKQKLVQAKELMDLQLIDADEYKLLKANILGGLLERSPGFGV
eukprot:7102739-Prymnesium_polylepis.1